MKELQGKSYIFKSLNDIQFAHVLWNHMIGHLGVKNTLINSVH